jgi:hypothetical protein
MNDSISVTHLIRSDRYLGIVAVGSWDEFGSADHRELRDAAPAAATIAALAVLARMNAIRDDF